MRTRDGMDDTKCPVPMLKPESTNPKVTKLRDTRQPRKGTRTGPALAETSPTVVRRGLLDCQVCVPADWSDRRVKAFAERENPCGTTNGWFIRRAGDKALGGDPERAPCEERTGYVHIVLDA